MNEQEKTLEEKKFQDRIREIQANPVLSEISYHISQEENSETECLVISRSGGTPNTPFLVFTRNGWKVGLQTNDDVADILEGVKAGRRSLFSKSGCTKEHYKISKEKDFVEKLVLDTDGLLLSIPLDDVSTEMELFHIIEEIIYMPVSKESIEKKRHHKFIDEAGAILVDPFYNQKSYQINTGDVEKGCFVFANGEMNFPYILVFTIDGWKISKDGNPLEVWARLEECDNGKGRMLPESGYIRGNEKDPDKLQISVGYHQSGASIPITLESVEEEKVEELLDRLVFAEERRPKDELPVPPNNNLNW